MKDDHSDLEFSLSRKCEHVGMWRSPVARTLGVGEVQGSNPCIPTIYMNRPEA